MDSDKLCGHGSSDLKLKSAASEEDMFADDPKEISDDTLVVPSYSNEEKSWRGTPLSELPQISSQCQFPPVVPSAHHAVLFKLPVKEGEAPKPWPSEPVDVWDQNHVRMPHSPSSLYPVTDTELRRRWELVQSALSSPITSFHQLEAAILHYNSKYTDRWDFTGLRQFFDETLEEVETEFFFSRVLPKVVKLALSLPDQLKGGLPLLRRHATHSISLTQKQISCLLANALLCTFPRRNTSKKNSEYCSFPDINFNRLFISEAGRSRGSSLQEKLKCLVNYFRRVTTKVPEGVVTYSRHYVPPERLPDWSTESCQLPPMHITSEGTIEDQGTGLLQIDFANKFVGGGVLGRGCVQEEIRFVICPELILARLFTEVLDDTEALIVTGCERYSQYRGYADSFEWDGNVEDTTLRDQFGRRICTVVAIDAFRFPNAKTQYSPVKINRELNKAYAGFSWGGGREAVATGNWGCGAFGGDTCLKALLQLMASAKAQRPVAYFTFGDAGLRDQVADMYQFLTATNVTVGRLWKVITSYNPIVQNQTLYDHIFKCILNKTIPVPLTAVNHQSPKKPRVDSERRPTTENCKKPDVTPSNGKRLNPDEISKVLGEVDDGEGGVKPLEAKTLSIQRDKELCLKRLSSSWTNLNESKKDFRPVESTSTSESIKQSASNQVSDKSKSSLVRQSSEPNKKKKISDYFCTVSKHKP